MVIALVILLVVVLGVFAAFAYATKWNQGNSQRSQSVSVFQREIELIRSAKFTPAVVSSVTTPTPTCATTDDGQRDITGGVKAPQIRCGIDGSRHLVYTTVDDDPDKPGLVDPNATLKEITIESVPGGDENTWITANKVRVVIRRVRAN